MLPSSHTYEVRSTACNMPAWMFKWVLRWCCTLVLCLNLINIHSFDLKKKKKKLCFKFADVSVSINRTCLNCELKCELLSVNVSCIFKPLTSNELSLSVETFNTASGYRL